MRKLGAVVVGCLVLASVSLAGEAAPKPKEHPLFAFCMDTHDAKARTLEQQAELIKELGFDGCGHLWLDNVQERLKTLDARGLSLIQIYLNVDIAPGKPAYDPRLKDVLPLLNGRGVMLALLVNGMKPSDPAGDDRAVEIVREIADAAAASGTRVVLYPHSYFWLERVEDSFRIAAKADRPNVGAMFNLCHFLKVDDENNLRPKLAAAMPRLFAVSINGADTAEEIHAGKGNWVQPLDSGTFDMAGFLKMLKELGYKGPIGLQCYGLAGDARDHMTRSISAWRRLSAILASPRNPQDK
ncbi:MAG TPA: sugar phosphate isomerase/epimerase family protein [Candidatus Brocadiia bacterium]|nr:sugar phosphate isomerase/epimerase family protein [Candidatus Brocadiia bacterium]